jgi:hypothetical protein
MTRRTKDDESIHRADSAVDLQAADTHTDLYGEAGRGTVVVIDQTGGEGAVVRNLTDCPTCGELLSDPVNIGWCLRCGYCRYLEEEAKQYEPIEAQELDPEEQFCVQVLRDLAKRLHGVKSVDRELQRNIDMVLALGQTVAKKKGAAKNLRKYHDLLAELDKKLKSEQETGDLIPITGYFDLLKGVATKFKADLDAEVPHGLLAQLNIPFPYLSRVPDWAAFLVAGLILFALGSFLCGFNLRRAAPHLRVSWCGVQVALGLAMILAGQSLAFLTVVPAQLRRRQWKLVVHPTLLWWAVWHRLPATSRALWLGAWGLSLVVGAALIMVM